MSHLNNGADDLLPVFTYDKSVLKELRKAKNLWVFGLSAYTFGMFGVVFLFMTQGIWQTVFGLAVLWPIIIVALNARQHVLAFNIENDAARFIKDQRYQFGNLTKDPDLTQEPSKYIDLDVIESNHHAGVIRVTVYRLLDVSSRSRDPLYQPMVFDLKETQIWSNGADPRDVLPLLLDAVSTDSSRHSRARRLLDEFKEYQLPVEVATMRTGATLQQGD